MDGWIKLHRALADHDLWTDEPFTRGQAWVDLLMLANHRQGFIRVRGNKIPVEIGQVGWSVKALSGRWKWSRGKAQRFLNELEKAGQIEQQKNFISGLISITNWNYFQKNGQQTDSRRTADGQQTDTNKNGKKNKNGKNNNPKPLPGAEADHPEKLQRILGIFRKKGKVTTRKLDQGESKAWKKIHGTIQETDLELVERFYSEPKSGTCDQTWKRKLAPAQLMNQWNEQVDLAAAFYEGKEDSSEW